MINFIIKIVPLVFCFQVLVGQSNLAIGEWKSHLAYREGLTVTQSEDNIIYGSQSGLIVINKDDLSASFLAKEDGFSGVNTSFIVYDKFNDQLIIVYKESNIDILKDVDVSSLPFIRTNSSIVGSRSINDLHIVNAEQAYFASDFGVLGFNPAKQEFPFTTFTDLRVFSVQVFNNELYAGTEEGLYKVALDGRNLSDFNQWTLIPNNSGLPQSYEVSGMAVKHGHLYAHIDNSIYKMNNDGTFSLLLKPSGTQGNIKFISDEGSSLMVGMQNASFSGSMIFFDENDGIKDGVSNCFSLIEYAIEDEKGRVWYADLWDPIKYTESKTTSCQRISFSGPFANTGGKVAFKKDAAYVTSQGITESFQPTGTRWGYYKYEDQKWTNYNQSNIPLMINTDFSSVEAIALDPKSPIVYVGGYWNGIIKYNEETQETEHFNKDNSILQPVVGDPARTRIGSLAFDKDENLWISNFGAPKPIVVKTKEDIWYSFAVPSSTSLTDIVFDDNDNKWIVVGGVGNGMIVFNENGSLADPTDDKVKYITRNNSEITGNKVNCIARDLDGSIWVGTDEGPVVFDCGDPFATTCRGNTRKVIVDNIPAPLLKSEDILSIGIDGANRKWFGTRNGIFVQSPDGTNQEIKFDTKNSPLLTDVVTELTYNPASGEMFIITTGGIQSFKTETTGGSLSHNSTTVYAYPNPVRPDHTGPIAIKGLVRDANVKITDINGKLIYETKALGGQAIWDGQDYNGRRAATGVYLVFSASENTSRDKEAFVTKILIVN
jgi:hypothetical protein